MRPGCCIYLKIQSLTEDAGPPIRIRAKLMLGKKTKMSSVEKNLIREYAALAATAVAEGVVAALTKITDTLSGDDSRLKNVWEEICVQVQGEESFFWSTYRDIMHDMVLAELEKLPRRDLVALWLQTDEGWDWHWDFQNEETSDVYRPSETPSPPCDLEAIANFVLEERLLTIAENYSNRNISAYLDGESSEDEDEDEDDEEVRERLVALMPPDTIVTDLWNWDIRFEDLSFDDVVEAAFSDGDELAHYAAALADDFLRWIDEYEMDYDEQSWPSHEEFVAWVGEQCLEFMTKWRSRVKAEFA